ncbi:Variant surface glycoprotein [Trypanosoma congolense IL3000]|uniref:Variant surface glycoprotein n=1 Tax=Trypanosoma congolense (strain IL3000) TaxID=1068625 RepID=F9WJD3_TRYCI|nr:Variant surface glycoprotein [Trypanosoma congolense IL3000]
MKLINVWVVMFMVVVCAEQSSASLNEDHNKEAHKALCDLMKAAVGKWGDRGQGLSEPMKKALGKTLFGREEGERVEDLKGKLPGDYEKVVNEVDSRGLACGQPYEDSYNEPPPRWSGHSAPHDMVCLCTLGKNGWPLNDNQKATTLCGKNANELGGGNDGWSGNGTGITQIKATWTSVATPCLDGVGKGDLKEKLKDFLRKLVQKNTTANPNRYQLGQGTPGDDHACTGTNNLGVCVMYYNSTATYPKPWWTELQNAIPEEEEIQKQLAEQEKQKHKEDAQKSDSSQEAVLKSAPTTTNQTEQNKHDSNLSDTIRKFSIKSGTPISMTSSWLLGALLLI